MSDDIGKLFGMAKGSSTSKNAEIFSINLLPRRLLAHLGHSTGSGDVMEGIDGIRAIAVILVVVFHIYAFGSGSPAVFLAGLDLRPWLATGFVGVDLFFVLSGFLLMFPWTKNHYKGNAVPSTREFYRRRVLRIMPAYYAHLAVFFLLMVPIAYSTSLMASPLGVATVLAHLSFTQYLFPQTSSSFGINGALWTLTIEAIFYLVLPFVARFFLGWRALLGLLVALLVAQGWLYLSFHELYDIVSWVLAQRSEPHYHYEPFTIKRFLALQFPAQALYFAAGMAITNIFFLRRVTFTARHLEGPVGALLTVLLLAGLFWIMWLIARVDRWHTSWLYVWHVIAAFMLGFLVLFAASSTVISRQVLGAPPLRIVGLISYSIYLWHLPVIFFVKSYFLPGSLSGVGVFHFMLLSCTPVILLIGYSSYRYIELPFLRRREGVSGGHR